MKYNLKHKLKVQPVFTRSYKSKILLKLGTFKPCIQEFSSMNSLGFSLLSDFKTFWAS